MLEDSRVSYFTLLTIAAHIRPLLRRGGVNGYKIGKCDGRDSLGRYYSYPSEGETTYAASGAWQMLKSDTSEIKSFDGTPATMLHIVVRKA